MSRLRTAAIIGAVSLPLIAGGFLAENHANRDGARLFDQVLNIVSDRFVDTLDTGALYEKAARGLVHELQDPYSELFSPKQLQQFSTRTNGRYGGIGMMIEDQQGAIVVSQVFPNTPASQAGVQSGDRIIQVDSNSTRGWKLSQVSDSLTGVPGTQVNVHFARPGVTEPIAVKFTRATIHVPAIEYAIMLDGKVGYVPLQQFNETAATELATSVKSLINQGAKGIIIDLRDDPGGILDEALASSNLFLKDGQEIASVRGRGSEPQVYVAKGTPLVPTTPLIILTNGYTASASEIVAGALQDHDRALIVGTTSFGKGLVQTLFPLDGGWALKVTTAKWYTPSGRSIQKERKLLPDGELVEVKPDSLEADSVKRNRPAYKSDQGRIVYGGGGITPDVIVHDDTITTAEQQFVKAIAPKFQAFYAVLSSFALSLKPQLPGPAFTVNPAWRDELYQKLQAAGVTVDRKLYDQGAPWIDRQIEFRAASLAYGDSTARRHEVAYDAPLRTALDLFKRGQTQRELFSIASATRGKTR